MIRARTRRRALPAAIVAFGVLTLWAMTPAEDRLALAAPGPVTDRVDALGARTPQVRPVAAPAITPGAPDPGAGAGTARADGSGDLWVPVAASGAAAALGVWAYRRRRVRHSPAIPAPASGSSGGGRGWGAPRPTPLPELDAQARQLLVATDDAVRTSREDVGFAAEQCGDAAARPFAEAVEYAREELTAAFRLRQRLDDAYPADDDTRRRMLDEILSRCTQANRRLDAESEGFDRLRAMEANAAGLLRRAEAGAATLPGRISAAETELRPLAGAYADRALEPVTGHPAEARDRLEFARGALDRARAALGTDDGRAAVLVRAAEGALGQAATLADCVTRRARELRAAETRLREALTAADADLAEARGLLDGAASGAIPGTASGTAAGASAADLRGWIARAETVVATVRAEAVTDRPDPVAALRRVEEASAALDAALAGMREEGDAERRARALLGRVLLTARGEVAAARDLVTTHRGAIGSQARTRLSEAERRLALAEPPAGTPSGTQAGTHNGTQIGTRPAARASVALEHAREADRLAGQAWRLAAQDIGAYRDRGAGRRKGGAADGGPGGAVLGGILLGDAPGSGRGDRAGGAPGGFGGGRTRRRSGGAGF